MLQTLKFVCKEPTILPVQAYLAFHPSTDVPAMNEWLPANGFGAILKFWKFCEVIVSTNCATFSDGR